MISAIRHTSSPVKCILCIFIVLVEVCRLSAQQPFTEEGQILTIVQLEGLFSEIQIDPSNAAIRMRTITPAQVPALDALGYRRTDRMVYGINFDDHHIYRLDANGMFEDLGSANLDPALEYRAGDITPDGSKYYVIGSTGGTDRKMYRIDLLVPGFPSTQIAMPGFTLFEDFAFDPGDPNVLYGYDVNIRNVIVMNVVTFGITGLSIIDSDYDVQGVYFDAYGHLKAFGTSTFGVAGAIFDVDKTTGVLTAKASGPVNRVSDLAAIPYSIEMENSPSARFGFPCNEITYTMTIVNRTGESHANVNFEARLPTGFDFKGVVTNPFGGNVNTSIPDRLRILGMNIPTGLNKFSFKVKIGDVLAGKYRLQGSLHNIPDRYGELVVSDDPLTVVPEDSTSIQVNRIDEDSIVLTRFLCLGETLVLDGGEFGADVTWSNGSVEPILEVTTAGVYTLQVHGSCQSTIVQFLVTAATCPFTIEVEHEMFPPETLPCSEVIFRFTFDNDSGTPRDGLLFTDTLPDGMWFLELLTNPLGGEFIDGMSADIIHIQDMLLPLGQHVMDIRVAVGDILPGDYLNQALLQNFPAELGPRRWSDDPRTPQLDPTVLVVLGVETDTLYVDEIICEGTELILDGTPYGVEHHWFNGSRDSMVAVQHPGAYELVVFDGCEPTYIYFLVEPGAHIEVAFDSTVYHIHLGDSILLSPIVVNAGNVLNLRWIDPFHGSLVCDTCLETLVFPRRHAEYGIIVENENCADSSVTRITVDNTRILFVPNVFTPNHDGINDRLTIYSPDYGSIESFQIIDRWGNVLFSTRGMLLNDDGGGWNGEYKSGFVPGGVYAWYALIRFLDDEVESFSGAVSLIR